MSEDNVPPIKFAIAEAGGPNPMEAERFDTREEAQEEIDSRDKPEDWQILETR